MSGVFITFCLFFCTIMKLKFSYISFYLMPKIQHHFNKTINQNSREAALMENCRFLMSFFLIFSFGAFISGHCQGQGTFLIKENIYKGKNRATCFPSGTSKLFVRDVDEWVSGFKVWRDKHPHNPHPWTSMLPFLDNTFSLSIIWGLADKPRTLVVFEWEG